MYSNNMGILVCDNSSIPVGGSVNCSGSYVVTERDLEAGTALTFYVSGSSPSLAGPAAESAPVSVDVRCNPQLTTDIVASKCKSTSNLGGCEGHKRSQQHSYHCRLAGNADCVTTMHAWRCGNPPGGHCCEQCHFC